MFSPPGLELNEPKKTYDQHVMGGNQEEAANQNSEPDLLGKSERGNNE